MDASPLEIAPEVYWLGSPEKSSLLQCNPYLVFDGGEGVLIEPGSPLDFDIVAANLAKLLPLEKVSYIVLGHQDPDLAASVPLFEKAGFKGRIACHWRTSVIVRYYGVQSEFYRVGDHENKLVLDSGRELHFIPTPYLHFPGAIATYDLKTRTLFSSDLFGAFLPSGWTLFADKERYLEAMKAFHEHYMPSNEIMRPVMESFLGLDIAMIAPQHGSIIRSDIRDYILTLRDLECGSFLRHLRKDLAEAGGYSGLCGQVSNRLAGVYPKEELLEAFAGSGITLNPETLAIIDFDSTGEELWDRFFELILARKGGDWLMVVEVLVEGLAGEYGIPLPSVFRARSAKAKREIDRLSAQAAELQGARRRLEDRLHETAEDLIRDGPTGLYNESFFRRFLLSEIAAAGADDAESALMIVSIDRLDEFTVRHGDAAGDEVVRSMAYFIKERLREGSTLFKFMRSFFAVFVPECADAESLNAEAETVREDVASSRLFLEPFTVSIGIVRLSELKRAGTTDPKELSRAMVLAAKARAIAAKQGGMNRIVATSRKLGKSGASALIIAADTDESNLGILGTAFESAGYRVGLVSDGQALLDLIAAEKPDFIISELMLPKLSAFAVRERMLALSELESIPFLILSSKKDEESVTRAQSLGIEHYFKKPYFLSELLGIVKLRTAKIETAL